MSLDVAKSLVVSYMFADDPVVWAVLIARQDFLHAGWFCRNQECRFEVCRGM